MKYFNFGDGNESANSNDVPWHSTFNKEKGNLGTQSIVQSVFICKTGLLLIAEDFKEFTYSGKKKTDFLLEALEYFVSHPSESLPFVLECSNKREALIGTVEEYEGHSVWIQDTKGYRFLDQAEDSLLVTSTNPFIPTKSRGEPTQESTGTKRTRKAS